MLWKDGHLSGYFAHDGSVFMVNTVGGDGRVPLSIDPAAKGEKGIAGS
jgi:hypothetical protein